MKTSQLLTEPEIRKRLAKLDGWTYKDSKLSKSYEFKDFKTAFSFVTRLADFAESINHHPDWQNAYNKVSLTLYTHHVKGVTGADIELAEAADKFAKETLQKQG